MTIDSTSFVARAVRIVVVLVALAAQAVGQAPAPAPASAQETVAPGAPPGGPRAMTPEDVEAFLDGVVPLQLSNRDIAGAAVLVVKDGRVLFRKGYGFADVAARTPVTPDATLFRPGSISKLFVWTAVMQQVERGAIDLDRDVNEYLDFRIPDAFGRPITVRNLLTHTPGFEEQVKDIFADDGTAPDLGAFLKAHVPARIYPPGTVPAYSNYGASLAAYVVERVTGRPFADYVEENIFIPLGMTRSTFRQPLPAELAPLMSKGYRLASDDPKPFEGVGPWPAGSLSCTADDMGRFILAHLQNGRLGNASILRPETVQLMHSRLLGLDDAANGMAYGFYEESRNGLRIVGHGGDTILFHSDLHLVPEAGIGFYVSYNSSGRGEGSPRSELWRAFLDRYFPYQPPAAEPLATAKADAEAVSGEYMDSRRSDSSFLKAIYLLQRTSVSARDDGTIEVDTINGPNGKPKRWEEIAPMVFREVHGQDRVVFRPDETGRMRMILPFPADVGQRAGFWESQKLVLPVFVVSLLLMLLTLVLWPVAAIVRWRFGHRMELAPADRWLRLGVFAAFALDLVFAVGILGLTIYGFEHLGLLGDGGLKWFRMLQAVGYAGTAGTVVVIVSAVRAWMTTGRIWSKLRATVLVLACAGFLWFVVAGNLLRFVGNF
jgi:CubicO group peptidase (beta-lactamase class C family)